MKSRLIFYAVIICLSISSCAMPNSPIATNTPTITPTFEPPTIAPTSTKPSRPLPTAESSEAPISTVVWGNALGKIIKLNGFHGEWSPTANEIVGVEVPNVSQNDVGRMVLSSAPNFSRVVLDEGHKNTVLNSLIWNLDGQGVLYGVSRYEECLGIDCPGSIWSVGRDGANPHPLSPDDSNRFGRGLEFWGWMDSHTIVYSSYAGGGHSSITEYDVLTNKVLVDDIVHVVEKGPLNSRYVPVMDCLPYCTTCILTRTIRPEQLYSLPSSYACRSDFYARGFPRDKNYPFQIDTLFQDWQPGTNNSLILANGQVDDAPVSRLFLWNADTDKVKTLIPGGVFGKFSPDGKMLAFVTYGSSDQYDATNQQNVSFDPIAIDNQPTLQMRDVSTRKTILSTPIRVKIISASDSDATSYWGVTQPDEFSFSPDGRYIVFATMGAIRLKDTHFPTEAIFADSTGVYLNILDLKTEQLTQSLPMDGLGENLHLDVLWSPNSDQFIYQDSSENWQLFKLSSNTSLPITRSNGSQLWSQAWSYDGSYLSFSQYNLDGIGAVKNVTTFILNLSNLP